MATRTLYLEIGLVNAIDHCGERWSVSRNEAAVRLIKAGLSSYIKAQVIRAVNALDREPLAVESEKGEVSKAGRPDFVPASELPK